MVQEAFQGDFRVQGSDINGLYNIVGEEWDGEGLDNIKKMIGVINI